MSSGSFTGTRDGLGLRVKSIKAPPSIFHFRKRRRRQPMPRFKRMLLVEDDSRDVELTLDALEESNLANEVDVARDGKEALDYLYYRGRFADRTRETPAVVLLDLKMPKVSGIDVLRQIKSDETLKMIPVVVLSSSGEERDVIESYQLG